MDHGSVGVTKSASAGLPSRLDDHRMAIRAPNARTRLAGQLTARTIQPPALRSVAGTRCCAAVFLASHTGRGSREKRAQTEGGLAYYGFPQDYWSSSPSLVPLPWSPVVLASWVRRSPLPAPWSPPLLRSAVCQSRAYQGIPARKMPSTRLSSPDWPARPVEKSLTFLS
jgi:hypothetical protein